MKRHQVCRVRQVWLQLACVSIAISAYAAGALGQTRSQVANGEAIAERLCVGCHLPRSGGRNVIEGVIVPSFSEIANRPQMAREQLKSLLAIPHRPMATPLLTPGELHDLAAYIMTLK